MSTPVTHRCKELGLKLKDAKKARTIELAVCDIRTASREDPQSCGFAKACRRQDPKIGAVYFFRSTAYVESGKTMFRYQVTPQMLREIESFDKSGKMQPGTYILRAPIKSWKLENLRSKPGRHKPKGTKLKRKIKMTVRKATATGSAPK